MKLVTTLVIFLTCIFSTSAIADAERLAESFNNSDIPSELVTSGWVENSGAKNFKIIQVFISHSLHSNELHIDHSGKIVTWINSARSVDSSINSDVDYQFFADAEDWEIIADSEENFMHHMTVGGLTFKGPMMEAMSKMQVIDKLLITIAQNIHPPAF